MSTRAMLMGLLLLIMATASAHADRQRTARSTRPDALQLRMIKDLRLSLGLDCLRQQRTVRNVALSRAQRLEYGRALNAVVGSLSADDLGRLSRILLTADQASAAGGWAARVVAGDQIAFLDLRRRHLSLTTAERLPRGLAQPGVVAVGRGCQAEIVFPPRR